MKILFVLEHFYPYIGGAEKLFYVLTTNLVKQGFEVVVVTTHFDKKLAKEEVHKGVKIVRVNCYNRYAFTFLSIPKVLKNAKGCDVIHTTTYNAALPAMMVGLTLRKPVYITFHEVWGKLWKTLPFTSFIERNAFYLFEKFLLHLPFHKFIAVSNFTKLKLIEHGIPAKKVERIYNGIDYDVFRKNQHTPPEVFTYTYFGRLGISKGLDLLLPAAAKFKINYPNSKLKLIIPKQPKGMYDRMMQLISTYDLEEYIEMLHNLSREQLYDELLHSSCAVIPSYSEGFCFAAAETVALKVPIISSDLGALKEVVSGMHIKMNSQSVDGLYTSLKEAYHMKWTKTPIQYYHLKDSISQYTDIYKRLTPANLKKGK
ncbi:MAG: glycosyltransferase family 4 protein [Saprospiraceae bacterium]|nr:glycosyltransferase family 4 protein [Saprospiraceae bacterium]